MNVIRRNLSAPRLRLVLAGLAAALVLGAGAACADDLKDGKAALQAGRLDDALRSFEKAAAQGYPAGRAGVGQVWLRRRQLDRAMEAFQLAQKMDSQFPWSYYGQGEVLRRRQKCEEAIPLFQRATELDSRFPEAQLALGDCYVQTKQLDKATAAFQVGLKWSKWAPRFLVGLGTAEMSRDSLRDAGIYFTRAREQAPDDPNVRRALGDFYLNRGTWALAVLEYDAAVALDTSDVELHYSLAQSLYYAERYDDALREYRWVTIRDPGYAPAQLGLGNLLYRAGAADPSRYVEARTALEKYTQAESKDAKGWSLLGRNYYFLRLRDQALEAMTKAEQLGDRNKEMYTVMGKALAERKEWDKALEKFEKGDPGPKEKLIIAQIYMFKYNPGTADSVYLARADSIYRSVIERDPTSTDAKFALNEIGKVQFRTAAKTRNYSVPLETFEKRIQLDPNNGEAYYYKGLCLKELGKWQEALAALQKATVLDSAKGDRFFWLGVLYDHEKQTGNARQAFERSVQLDSISKVAGKAYRQLGFYALLDKSWSAAIRLLDRAVQLDDRDVQAWVWLGQGYQNSGNRARALECYRKALELDPGQPDASKGVKVLTGAVVPGRSAEGSKGGGQ